MKKDDRSRKSEKNTRQWNQFGAFFKCAHLSWGWIILSMVITMVYYTTVSKLPGSTAALFSGKFTTKAITDVVINYGTTMVFLVIVGVVSLVAEAKSVLSVRKAVWSRMMGIQSKYYDEHSANQLLSAVTSDTEVTVSLMMQMLVTVPGLITYLLTAIPQIGGFSLKLLWAVVIPIPLYIIYAFFMGKWQHKVGMRIQVRIGGLTGYLTDRIRNLSLIKSFVTEQQEEEKGVNAAQKLYKANIEMSYVNAVVVTYTVLADVLGTALAVLWGCTLLRSGEIDMQSWLAFFLFTPTVNTMIRKLTGLWPSLKDMQGRAARLGAMMEAPQENLNETAPSDIPAGDITLDHVTFSYGQGIVALDDVNFTIPCGKTTAIVGLSGSGKTTMLKLLQKLYSPDQGEIRIGDQNLEDLNLTAWREQLSYVNQGAELFSGTIRQVLTYGVNRVVSDAELDSATTRAGIREFIAQQPADFDTEVAIWGSTMSGGQRQRMVIAREILKNSNVIMLDEPTSALDVENAASVSDVFFEGFRGKTIITVTHELNFIAHADQIVVVNSGKVVGVGTHEQLMQSNDLYRQLVQEQSYQEVFSK